MKGENVTGSKESGRRRRRYSPDDEDRSLSDPSVTRYHFAPEEAGPTERRSQRNIPPNIAEGLAALERALGVGSGSRINNEDRSLSGAQVISVPQEEETRILLGRGRSVREVPPHLDQELAWIERGWQNTVDTYSTESLLRQATRKNQDLFRSSSPMGPCQRSAIAESLILINNTLDSRIVEAEFDSTGYPIVEGLEWDPDDPFRGNLESIPPFSMLDIWRAILSEQSALCAAQQHAAQQPARIRRTEQRRATQDLEAHAVWRQQGLSPFADVVPGTRIYLDASSSRDPLDRLHTYVWTMRQPLPSRSRATIINPTGHFGRPRQISQQTYFIADVVGTYQVTLEVRTSDSRTDIDTCSIQVVPTRRTDIEQPEQPRSLVCHPEWLERARSDESLNCAARLMLHIYPNLDPEYLPRAIVRDFYIYPRSIVAVRDMANDPQNNPNNLIRHYLCSAVSYEDFRLRIANFRERVRSSARLLSGGCGAFPGGTIDRTNCYDRFAEIIKREWYWPLQSRRGSVYWVSSLSVTDCVRELSQRRRS